jgi:hypothetical protein
MTDYSLIFGSVCIAAIIGVIYMESKANALCERIETDRQNAHVKTAKEEVDRQNAYAKVKVDRQKLLAEFEELIETERAAKEALEAQLRYELSSMTVDEWNSLDDHGRSINENLCKQYEIPFPSIQESSNQDSIEQNGER